MSENAQRPDRARDRMMGEITAGADVNEIRDFSSKSILARGCDPQMALRASKILPPLLGNPTLVSCTDDDDFLRKLTERRWSVVFFAPGACRYDNAGVAIPGARPHTLGWSLTQYRDWVREHQGDDVQIVETPDERETIPRLRQALEQSHDVIGPEG